MVAANGLASSIQQWAPSVNVAAPNVYVQAIPDGEYVRTEARVVFGQESTILKRQKDRAGR